MSEEKVQDNVQENLGLEVENKTENADSGLLQEIMSKKATIKELKAKLADYETASEKRRQKRLSDDGKKDELIAELNTDKEKMEAEIARLSKYENDEKTKLIASIASTPEEAELLSKEKLSTLRLLDKKIAPKTPEAPTARGSVGNQPPPKNWAELGKEELREKWGDVLNCFKK